MSMWISKRLADSSLSQTWTVQHRCMAGSVPNENGLVTRHGIKISPGRMSFFRQEELIVSVASEPFSGRSARHTNG
jgi:hypothetical protein